jgi:hypothetical protein
MHGHPPKNIGWVVSFKTIFTLDYILFTIKKLSPYITGITFKAYQVEGDRKTEILGGMK